MSADPKQNNKDTILGNIIKYVLEGAAVAFVAYYILPNSKKLPAEIATLALTASLVFMILDLYAPAVSDGARMGAGFGIGAGLVGFPK